MQIMVVLDKVREDRTVVSALVAHANEVREDFKVSIPCKGTVRLGGTSHVHMLSRPACLRAHASCFFLRLAQHVPSHQTCEIACLSARLFPQLMQATDAFNPPRPNKRNMLEREVEYLRRLGRITGSVGMAGRVSC